MNFCYSAEYTPLLPDWRPPDWIPEAPQLKPVDSAITERLTKATKGKLFSPPDRLPTSLRHTVKPVDNAFSIASRAISTLEKAKKAFHRIFKISREWAANGIFRRTRSSDIPLPTVTEEEIKFILQEARKNPLLEQLWNTISTKQGNIQLYFVDKTHFQNEHIFARCSFKQSNVSQGTCTISDPQIWIMKDIPLKMIFSGLIFEIVNLFQAERFAVVWQHAGLGQVDRNQLALLIEYVEAETSNLAHQIFDYGVQHLNWHPNLNLWKQGHSTFNFAAHWERCNRKASPTALSHADTYRYQWDRRCGEV